MATLWLLFWATICLSAGVVVVVAVQVLPGHLYHEATVLDVWRTTLR